MTDDEWWAVQQRRHNIDSYRHQPPPEPVKRRRPGHFTLEQLLVAERWAQRVSEKSDTSPVSGFSDTALYNQIQIEKAGTA